MNACTTLRGRPSHRRSQEDSHDDPQNLDRSEGKDGQVVRVLEGQTYQKRESLHHVTRQEMHHEFGDVVEHPTALFNRVEDAGEAIICEDKIGRAVG